MTPLIPHFDLLATAPGGVARLRELILTLAVQGKLVPQDPNDEPASVLLQKIRAEKDRLIAAGKIKRDKLIQELDSGDFLFQLPMGWEWTRLGQLVEIKGGKRLPSGHSFSEKPTPHAYIQVTNMKGGSIVKTHLKYLSVETFLTIKHYTISQDDLYITIAGTIGQVGEVPPEFHLMNLTENAAKIVFNVLNKHWLCGVLNSDVCQDQFAEKTVQQAQPKLALHRIADAKIPLPPLSEQSRIVTRVEELMRLCDALESQRQLETAQHAQLLNTLLGTLTDSTSPDELAANWQRVSDHFDLLLDRPQAVDALEQTILQLAVRGLLVPQDPTDEPASVLLQKIRAEKDRLIAAGEIKRDKPLPAIAEEEKPFELPQGWTCARFPDLTTITGGSTPSKAVAEYWVGNIPWVSPKDMKVAVITDAQDHVSESALQGSLSLIPSGSLLMVVRGMILAHSFPVAQTAVPVTINQDMKALTPLVPDVLPFLTLICQGMKPEILGLVDRSTHGTCKMESPKIFGMAIPLPPLAEQTRIVTRVNQLRSLCADLRQRLSVRQTTQSHLAEALVEV